MTDDEKHVVELAESYVVRNGYTDAPLGPDAFAQLATDKRKAAILWAVRKGTLKPEAYGVAKAAGSREWFVIFLPTGKPPEEAPSPEAAGQAVLVDLEHQQVELVDKMFLLAAVQKRLTPTPW